jgi:hypothetical protein
MKPLKLRSLRQTPYVDACLVVHGVPAGAKHGLGYDPAYAPSTNPEGEEHVWALGESSQAPTDVGRPTGI